MIINQEYLIQEAPIKNMLKEKVRGPHSSHGLTECGYDIRIQQQIHFHYNNGVPEIHWYDPVTKESGVKSGRFILANAIEEFQMPTNLVGVVHDKSTWGREGVAVQNTVIEPGWKGFLTLEISFQDNKDVIISAGDGIAQVIFDQIVLPANYGDGKYQNQERRPVEAIMG